MTMQELARIGAQQVMAGGDMELDDDLDGQNSSVQYAADTTAVSDRNSQQNFSYYGRRFMAQSQNKPMSPEPGAENLGQSGKFKNSDNQGANSRVLRQNSNTRNDQDGMSNHTMSEAVSYDIGIHKRNNKQYNLEEKMNEGLMKQFKGMFDDESQV